jgi:superfamily II DNA or RNA helicase
MTESSRELAPVRLAYRLHLSGRTQSAALEARHAPEGTRLDEAAVKHLLPALHPIDTIIARELLSATIFGQLSDQQLARLLPLLAQRQTRLGEHPLIVDDAALLPRLAVERGASGTLRLVMWLADRRGARIDLASGRLIAGSQAYFVQGTHVRTVASGAPWELASWGRSPVLEMLADLAPHRRDELVRTLAKAGVPQQDLAALAVRRAPPDTFVVNLASREAPTGPEVLLALEADYGGTRVLLGSRDPTALHLVPDGQQDLSASPGLIERDVETERTARRLLASSGFRFDTQEGVFVARGEAALRALDPGAHTFPSDWQIERSGTLPLFRQGLEMRTEVRLLEERGLLELTVGIGLSQEDDQTVRALVGMKDLLAWLSSTSGYVRLADGSYVAPSARLRQSLRLLHDLGADGERVLCSPLCIGVLRAMGNLSAIQAADAATHAWLDEVSGAAQPRPVPPPPELADVLRDYQRRGLDWLMMLHRHRLTGILADDMGLGKTLQTLALLSVIRQAEGGKPSLVVAPTSVLAVWRDEAARFTPSLKVALWSGPPAERRELIAGDYDLVVTSYGILRRDSEHLAAIDFRYVILDEAQSAKNAATQNARAIRRLRSERRLALTGTPIENRPEELWAAFDFLAPGFLGSLRGFRRRYARPIEHGDAEPLMLLAARVQPLVMRRLKRDVARELPPKIESVVRCEMLAPQRALYDHVADRLKESVRRKIESVGLERAHMAILAALTRLRQICCDPALLPVPEGVKTPESAKLALFEELMREALESERRVVVFSQFVEMQKRLIAVIRRLGVDPLWLHGGTRHRDKVVAAFQDPEGPPVIVVSLRAGGTGVTLTRADTVMHYDPWWNPAVERQATDRTHRLGQTQQVTVYKLVCARSIEERVLEMATRKDELAERLLGSEGAGPKRISVEDVMQLLG